MRSRMDWKSTLGSLALLGSVALASPGVRVAAAEPIADGGSCSGAPTSELVQLDRLDRARLREQARIARDLQREPGNAADRPVALNNRGYNYGAAPGVDAAELAELQAR